MSGAALLLLELNDSLTPDEIETILQETGVTVGDYKRIDILAAINSIRDSDGDGYVAEGYGGNDCDDSDGGVHPGASETCDGKDNDCDDLVDEGCSGVQECEEPGYEQCISFAYGDCEVAIAANFYDNVNTIKWDEVNDSYDPYVVGNYKIGWTNVKALEMYYDNDVNNTCQYGGCDGSAQVDVEDIITTVSAPGIAYHEMLLGYNQTDSWACWDYFYEYYPNFGSSNPIYVLNCYSNSDCSGSQFCDKSGAWDDWDCVSKYSDGHSCTEDYQCTSGYCDNDGEGLSDDNWCFTPYNTYFDGQETSYCEYSTDAITADCDERQTGDDLNKCVGTSYYEEECSSACAYLDVTTVFECTETGCSCSQSLCDGLTTGDSITTCSAGQTYFADKCNSTAGGEDRGDSICRSSAFAAGCTGDAECNTLTAGTSTETGSCSAACIYDAFPTVALVSPPDGNISKSGYIILNCSAADDNALANITLYHNASGAWLANETQALNGTNGSAVFTLNITEDTTFIWNCRALDNASQAGWASANRSITVDHPDPPNISVSSLSVLFSSGNERLFEFSVDNSGDGTLTGVNWTFDTGEGVVLNSTQTMTLGEGESVLVYVHYAFTQEEYSINVTVSSGNLSASQTLGGGNVLQVASLQQLRADGTDNIFGFTVLNNDSSPKDDVSWILGMGDGTVLNSSMNMTLNASEEAFVFVRYNYSSTGDYTVTATAVSGGSAANQSISIEIPELDVKDLTAIYSGGTRRIFEFIIANELGSQMTGINFTFDTGDGTRANSTQPITLAAGEEIFVYYDYNYSGTGTYAVNASATDGTHEDSANITITIS